MVYILIGNLVALIGSGFMAYSGTQECKKKFLFLQTIQIFLFVISNILLGGITGAIINFISCIRNILCYKNKLSKNFVYLLIVVSTIISLYFNNLGYIGLLPVLAFIVYTLFINIKDVFKFKILVILVMLLWLIYDICIKSYTSAIFDVMSIITNIISIISIRVKEKK